MAQSWLIDFATKSIDVWFVNLHRAVNFCPFLFCLGIPLSGESLLSAAESVDILTLLFEIIRNLWFVELYSDLFTKDFELVTSVLGHKYWRSSIILVFRLIRLYSTRLNIWICKRQLLAGGTIADWYIFHVLKAHFKIVGFEIIAKFWPTMKNIISLWRSIQSILVISEMWTRKIVLFKFLDGGLAAVSHHVSILKEFY